MNLDVHFSSNSDEWATPQDLFDRLNDEFHFSLDVCASTENAKLPAFYTMADDGLSKPWSERNWCNPPYSELKKWVQKAHLEQLKGNLTVMLIPARTDTAAFHDYMYLKPNVEIRFLRGRLKFGNSKNSAPFPSMVVILRPA